MEVPGFAPPLGLSIGRRGPVAFRIALSVVVKVYEGTCGIQNRVSAAWAFARRVSEFTYSNWRRAAKSQGSHLDDIIALKIETDMRND